MLPWCSGYHIRLTRGRSPVQSWAVILLAPCIVLSRMPHTDTHIDGGGARSAPLKLINFGGALDLINVYIYYILAYTDPRMTGYMYRCLHT